MTIHFPRVGERFLDRYQITEVLGAGGMSRVYGAIQDGLDRKVAIKLLAPAGAENLSDSQFDNIAARFRREAKLISRFRSSHTVVMYDYGHHEDYLFMILEHVDGKNLHELVEAAGPLPATRVARIMRQALSSLAEAHEMGILHRDIKPQNIMVYEHLGDPDNTKVLDFGIAKAIGETGRDARKLTEERTIIGTPSYMSPEQILGNQLTPASDLYSLGLVAYELLFGIVAVEADSAVSTMARHLAPMPIEIPDDRQMPEAFLDILRRMIAKDVAQRYMSASEVIADLNAWDGGDVSLTMPRLTPPSIRQDTMTGAPPISGPGQTTTQAPSTRPLVVTSALLTVAILVAVGVVVGLVWMMGSRAEEVAPTTAETEQVAPTTASPAVVAPSPTEQESPQAEPVQVVEVVEPNEVPTDIVEPIVGEEPAELVAAVGTEPEPVAKKAPVVAAKKKASKTLAADPAPAETPPVEAIDPPEPLVVEPAPAPAEPAPTPAPTPAPVVVEKPPTKTTASTKEKDDADEKDAKKKKKKKKKAPPLSF